MIPTAEVLRSHAKHDWAFANVTITGLLVDASSLRLQAWHLEGGIDILFSVPFGVTDVDGVTRLVDPEEPETLTRLLTLSERALLSARIEATGTITLAFGDGSSLRCERHRAYEAWESHGTGPFAEFAYLCMPGAGAPWGAG